MTVTGNYYPHFTHKNFLMKDCYFCFLSLSISRTLDAPGESLCEYENAIYSMLLNSHLGTAQSKRKNHRLSYVNTVVRIQYVHHSPIFPYSFSHFDVIHFSRRMGNFLTISITLLEMIGE